MSSDKVSGQFSGGGQTSQGIATCSLPRKGSELDPSSWLTWKVPEGWGGLSISLSLRGCPRTEVSTGAGMRGAWLSC